MFLRLQEFHELKEERSLQILRLQELGLPKQRAC